MNEPKTDLLTTFEAARLLGISPGTLANWRSKGRGPVFVKLGAAVRYWQRDLAEFVQRHRVQVPAGQRP